MLNKLLQIILALACTQLLLSCKAFAKDRLSSVSQSYSFTCSKNVYEAKFQTSYQEGKPPASKLLSITVNNKKPKNTKAVSELETTISKITGIDLPPISSCGPSNGQFAISSFRSGTVDPVVLIIYFYAKPEIEFRLYDADPNTYNVSD